MARRSRPAPRPAARSPPRPAQSHAPPPAHAAPAPPPAHPPSGGGGSMIGGMMGMIGQGLAFGSGSAVAHRAVDAVVGPRTVTHEHVSAPGPEAAAAGAPAPQAASGDACAYQAKSFADCVQHSGSDISKCQFYLDMLNDCKRNSSGI